MTPRKPLSVPFAVLSLPLSLAVLATACGPEDGALAPLGALPQAQSSALQALPTTCAELQAAHPGSVDGQYTLYLEGNAFKPWTAWCHDMAGTPTEYLTLPQDGERYNFSTYTAGGSAPGTTVRTAYYRLRINPSTLKVNTADQTFTKSTGSVAHSPYQVTAMPLGVAMSCNRIASAANIDLRETSFALADGQFGLGGADAAGSIAYSEQNQVVNLTGSGFCGWAAPQGSYNPINQTGTWLQLQYRSSFVPSSCLDIQAVQPTAPDGEYTLYFQRDPLKPWSAWCHGMAGTPTEYLSLVQTGTANYAQYTATSSQGTNVRTTFTRLRLDPVTLRVSTSDQRFSTSTGALSHGQERVTSMPYAAAMGCGQRGVGNVDLRGTPFAVSGGAFRLGGVSVNGSYPYSEGNRVVSLSASGGCGWVGPVGSYNPFNQNGLPLPLVYAGQP